MSLTPAKRRALQAIADAGEQGHSGRSLARELWPDSPAWERTTRSRPGFNGSKGGTMPMNGARIARQLADIGLVYISYTLHHLPIFTITQKGRQALEQKAGS